MKVTKKLLAVFLTLVMVMGFSITAFAQNVSVGSGSASITISNAAKGETYSIYKLFDASVTGDNGGSIVYTGEIPDSLNTYFIANNGYVTATDAAYVDSDAEDKVMSDGLRSALKTWVESATAVATAESDGSTLTFTGLPYGYYVVTTSQGENAITVTSTNPNAEIVDKNATVPVSGLTKTVDNDNVSIGDTVTYTVKFPTANYSGSGTAAKKIVSYTIEDTLPDFLTNVNVTSIIVDADGDAGTAEDQEHIDNKQFDDKTITLDWYDEDTSSFIYDNGATVTITYTAVVTEKAAIAGAGNTNTVNVFWTDVENNNSEGEEASATIYTYAFALKKVDDEGTNLADAVFELPFYVEETPDSNGAYVYAGEEEAEGLTKTVTTPADGLIIIKGVASGTYYIEETEAPDGYNKLADPFEVTVEKQNATVTNVTKYIDQNGSITDVQGTTSVNVTIQDIAASVHFVVNKTGALLPSTGGMGTTVIYIIGAVLVIGAGIVLVVRRRTNA